MGPDTDDDTTEATTRRTLSEYTDAEIDTSGNATLKLFVSDLPGADDGILFYPRETEALRAFLNEYDDDAFGSNRTEVVEE